MSYAKARDTQDGAWHCVHRPGMHGNEYLLGSIVQRLVWDSLLLMVRRLSICAWVFTFITGFGGSIRLVQTWSRAMQWQGVFRDEAQTSSVTQGVAAAMFIFLMARIPTEQFLIFYRRTDTSVWMTLCFSQAS